MDWRPTASLETLRRRARLLRAVRTFFDARGFWEVETPILSNDVVVDRHLDPFDVVCDERRRCFLQTSPEFGMKRLVAAGADAIYQVTRAFRQGERGRLHNPEFTIVEWYRVGDNYSDGMNLLAELACHTLGCDGVDRVSYAEAFLRHAGVDPHRCSAAELDEAARRLGVAMPEGFDGDDVDSRLEVLLVERVEPHLGIERPALLYDYPAGQSALAQVRTALEGTDNGRSVAERFELYARGIELANGYHELLDADVLSDRIARNNELRARDGKSRLPEKSRLLDAMRHGLPSCSGTALGFDRLVMTALGLSSIDEAIPFPIERA